MVEAGAKIVSLRGEEIVQPGTPRPAVIEILEQSLEMARSGEVVGVFIARLHSDDATTGGIEGAQDRGLIGLVEMLKADLIERENNR